MPTPDAPYQELADAVNTPMYVVTAASGEERAGCLVGFSVQCSIDPLRHLVCLSKANRTYEVACGAEWLVVHALHEGDDEVASLFGEVTDRDVDKFTCCAWHPGPGGAPVIDGCDWFAGRIVDRVDLGDHEGFVLAVTDDGSARRADDPRLGFQDVRDLEAGNPA
jgi:flavin reductase (DIM6/NTAB) family NADH-FMN oxidoreductase RutF